MTVDPLVMNKVWKGLATGAKIGLAGAVIGGVGLGVGTAIARKDRNVDAEVQANFFKSKLMAGALGIGALGFAFRKPLNKGIGKLLGSNSIARGMGKMAVGTFESARQSVMRLEEDILRPLVSGRRGLDFWDAYFPNAKGVTPDNLLDKNWMGKNNSRKLFDRMVQKEMRKNPGSLIADVEKKVLDELNENPFQRLRLRSNMSRVVMAAGAIATASNYTSGATFNPAPQPSTFYDGVSMRHVNDLGVNQEYANAVSGVSSREIMAMVGRSL